MTHVVAAPFAHTSGPKDALTVICGEAWGDQEELTGMPFVGNSGQELSRLLEEAGIPRGECLLTNVFALRPEIAPGVKTNNIKALCAGKKEVGGQAYTLPPLSTGAYVRPEYLGEVNRLKEELDAHPRNLVIALGSSACWALLGKSGIGAQRGAIAESSLSPGTKVLPTYHPSYLFQMWQHRPVVLADLLKAARERQFPDIRRPERYLTVNPSLAEISVWFEEHGRGAAILSADIETGAGQIKMIGFATGARYGLVIPFVDLQHPSGCYWSTQGEELAAWEWVQKFLLLPCPKLFQNGLFDLQYILGMGLTVAGAGDDTMLLHHALYPELQKGLGFLGSIYTNEAAWKMMRGQTEELKRDE